MANKSTDPILTPEFRLAFPSVFKPNSFGNNEKFDITMLFPKSADITALKMLARDAVVMAWGEDKTRWPESLTLPFGDGDEKPWEGFAGCTFIRASSTFPPGVVDNKRAHIIDPNLVYSGCYAIAQVNTWAWTYMGKSGVSFGLVNLQIIRDGDPLGGRMDAAEVFDAVPGADLGAGGIGATSAPGMATRADGDIFT